MHTRSAHLSYFFCSAALAVGICYLTPVLAAQAQPQAVNSELALGWARGPGAETCISPAELTQRVEAQLGSVRFGTAHNALLTIEGAVAPQNDGGFVATIAVSDGSGRIQGRRELKTDFGCRELDEGLALVIAVTVRGSVSGLSPTAASLLEALFSDVPGELAADNLLPAPNPAATVSPTPANKRPASSAGRPVRLEPGPTSSASPIAIYAGGFISSGLQPSAAFGPTLGLAWVEPDYGRLVAWGSLGLGRGDHVIVDPTATENGADGRVHGLGMLWTLGLSACPFELRPPGFDLSICLDGQLGQIQLDRTTGFGVFERDTVSRRLWISTGASLELRRELESGFFVWLTGRGNVAVRRAEYRYIATNGTSRRLFRSDLLAAQVNLGVGFRWP